MGLAVARHAKGSHFVTFSVAKQFTQKRRASIENADDVCRRSDENNHLSVSELVDRDANGRASVLWEKGPTSSTGRLFTRC